MTNRRLDELKPVGRGALGSNKYDLRRDVVVTTLFVGTGDELSHCLGRRHRCGDAGDLHLGHEPVKAVTAEHEEVAILEGHGGVGELDLDLGPPAERTADDVRVGMVLRLLLGEEPFVHETLHHGVVFGHATEDVPAEVVDAAIANMGDVGLAALLVDANEYDGGAHAAEFTLSGGLLVDGVVGFADGLFDALPGRQVRLGEPLLDDRHREARGGRATCVATHAVTDEEGAEPGSTVRAESVLVLAPLTPHIGVRLEGDLKVGGLAHRTLLSNAALQSTRPHRPTRPIRCVDDSAVV